MLSLFTSGFYGSNLSELDSYLPDPEAQAAVVLRIKRRSVAEFQ